MSGVVSGIGKVFKKIAPIAIPVAIGAITGGPAGAAMGAVRGGGSMALGSVLNSFGDDDGSGGVPTGQGGTMFRVPDRRGGIPTPLEGLPLGPETTGLVGRAGLDTLSASGSGSTTTGGGITRWIEDHPETTRILAGAAGGLVSGYQKGRELEEKKRQFDLGRRWPGAFYGRT
jgi:hypothetical protein